MINDYQIEINFKHVQRPQNEINGMFNYCSKYDFYLKNAYIAINI